MVTYEIRDQVAVLKMDDGKANALNGNSLASIENALDATRSAGALVLLGRAGFFSGGLDLKTLPTLPADQLGVVLGQFLRVIFRLVDSPVPIVAAVTGHAMAGGAILALACDYAVGLQGGAKIGLNEAAIGLPLPPIIVELGRSKLTPRYQLRAMAHGEIFSHQDAVSAGFLDEVAEPADIEAKVLARAAALAVLPKEAYLQTKRDLRKFILSCPLEDASGPLLAFFSKIKGLN